MASVFISYAREDEDFATSICDRLRREGHVVWLDHLRLAAGDSIVEGIGDGLQNADALLLVWSRNAHASPWVAREWQSTLARELSGADCRVIVARVDDTALPPLLHDRVLVDFSGDRDRAMSQLSWGLTPGTTTVPVELPTVWYFDDDPQRLDDFHTKHSSAFDLRLFGNSTMLLHDLREAALGHLRPPDIALVDMYMPRDHTPALASAQEQLRQFLALEKELKHHVDQAWHPIGRDVVQTVREYYTADELPVAIHTQRGLALLRDELVLELNELDVGWLLKDRFSPETDRMIIENVIKKANGRPATARHRSVLVIDDNPKFLHTFVERHGLVYDVTCIESQGDVLPTLDRLQAEQRFPDIFLVDLYYPRSSVPDQQPLIELANRKLAEFQQFETALQPLVRETFSPIGITVVKSIRGMFEPEALPIIIYTQGGLLMLEDSGIQKIEKLKAGWLLKDRYEPMTEQALIYSEIMRSR